MPILRYIFLISLVILAGGGTIWVAYAAAMAGQLSAQVLMTVMPLAMVAALALRSLTGRKS
ncbi:MAG: hypothetical protein P8X50_12600 [Maritimibacter sp.]